MQSELNKIEKYKFGFTSFRDILPEILIEMQAEYNPGKMNSFETPRGNIMWGAALTLAWKELCNNIIKAPIKLQSKEPLAVKITDNFNNSPTSVADLSPECYYVKSGFGNQTIRLINKEVSQKFPDKTTGALQQNLPDDGIISYAYFLKNLKFQFPFTKKKVDFCGKDVAGFHGSNAQQKGQILVHKYNNKDSFIVELATKSNRDHIYLIKSKKPYTCEQIIKKIPDEKVHPQPLTKDDVFQMPKVSVHAHHSVKELVKKKIANKQFDSYFFSEIYEIVKLDIDQTGVKVENEGVIMMFKCAVIKPVQPKLILIDSPFWIIMIERGKQNPYFVSYIKTLQEK